MNKLLPITMIGVFCISCSHYYYGPNSNNTPLLKEKEAKLNLQYAATTEFEAFEVQSAAAISKHTGVMLNYITGGGNDNNDFFGSNGESGHAHEFEFGAGYFTPIKNTALVFETFGGMGFGAINNTHYRSELSKVKFTKYFIQPEIGVRKNGFEFGFSSRFSFVNQTLDFSSVTSDNNDDAFDDLIYLKERPGSFLWEPGIVLRAGGQKFLVQVQYTWSTNINNPEMKQEHGIFNIGFCIPIDYQNFGQ